MALCGERLDNSSNLRGFQGFMNGILISDSNIYSSMEYIIDEMQYKLHIDIQSREFTKDLYNAYDAMVHSYGMPLEEIEEGFLLCIRRARGDISALSFEATHVFENVPELEYMQKKINAQKYHFG